MSTPFLAYENARILWVAPGERLTGRDGYGLAVGQNYIIGAFLKRERPPAGLSYPGLGGEVTPLAGYVTRYAPVDTGTLAAAAAWWSLDWADLPSLDATGLAPAGLRGDAVGRIYLPGMGEGAAVVTSIGTDYGAAGIGDLLRQRTGDPVVVTLGRLG